MWRQVPPQPGEARELEVGRPDAAAQGRERVIRGHTSPRKSVDYLLSRLIRCEHCGSNFIGRRHTYQDHNGEEVTQLSYYCSGYLYKGRSVCPSLPVDAAWVESFVLDIVQARLCEAEAWAELQGRLRARIEGRRKKYGQDPKAAEARLPFVLRREVVLHFIDEIVVHDRRELRVRFKVPFDNLGVEHLCDEAEGRGQNARRPAG